MCIHPVPLVVLTFVSLSLSTGCGDRNPGGGAGRDPGAGSSSGGSFERPKPPPSFTPNVPSAYPLFACETFDLKFVDSLFNQGKLLITNRNNEPDLINVNVTLTIYLEDGTSHQIKRFWASWKRNEQKSIDEKVRKIQKVSMEGTAQLNSSIQGKGRISTTWTVNR